MNSKSNANLDARLRSLSGSLGDDPTFAQRTLSQIEAQGIRPGNPRSIQLRRWLFRGSMGLAASALIGAVVWSLLLTSPRRAYAITDMPQRILSLNSLHTKGTTYAPGGPAQAFEMFAQQPDRIRRNGVLVDNDDGYPRHNGYKVNDIIYSAGRCLMLDASKKTAIINPEDPDDIKYHVAEILQNEVQTMFGAAQNFTKVRSETLAGVQTDVYHCKILENKEGAAFCYDIWFNPATGLPVKTAFYMVHPNCPDQLISVVDTIEADPVIDPALFDPKIPSDYKVEKWGPTDDRSVAGYTLGGMNGHVSIRARYGILLDKGDVLLCWAFYDERHPADDLAFPDAKHTLTIYSTISHTLYSERLLHADPEPDGHPPGYHWRWSLLHPAKEIPPDEIRLSATDTDQPGGKGETMLTPVIFRPKDLADFVQLFQRKTLPAGQVPLTLQQIEQPPAK